MDHVRFGRTGLRVSRLCLGTMTFGYQCDEAQSHAILDAAAEDGITFIDTADAYPLGAPAEQVGRTEEIVGSWLSGRRDRFVIATKCHYPTGPSPWDRGNSRQNIMRAIEASLRRLRTDHVDLYQLHAWDRHTPIDESLLALDDLVHAGKVRYAGISNLLAYQLARSLGRSEVLGVARFESLQPRYNLLFRQPERELLPLCAEEQVAVIPYNPLAGGLLTGKHRPEGRTDRGHAVHPRQRGRALHGPLLARPRVRDGRRLAAGGRRRRTLDGRAGRRVGAGQPRHHQPDPRRQPARAAGRRRPRRPDARWSRTSRPGSTSSRPSTAPATPSANAAATASRPSELTTLAPAARTSWATARSLVTTTMGSAAGNAATSSRMTSSADTVGGEKRTATRRRRPGRTGPTSAPSNTTSTVVP